MKALPSGLCSTVSTPNMFMAFLQARRPLRPGSRELMPDYFSGSKRREFSIPEQSVRAVWHTLPSRRFKCCRLKRNSAANKRSVFCNHQQLAGVVLPCVKSSATWNATACCLECGRLQTRFLEKVRGLEIDENRWFELYSLRRKCHPLSFLTTAMTWKCTAGSLFKQIRERD